MITILIAAAVVVADQISKFFILRNLMPVGDIPVWNGVLHLHYAQNTGASFGMLPGFRWVFLTLSIIFVIGAFIFAIVKGKKMDKFALITLGLISGGALGNAIDRLRFGYVVDFLYVKLINFAIFNVADAGIVIGAILMGIYVLFIYKEPDNESEDDKKEANG